MDRHSFTARNPARSASRLLGGLPRKHPACRAYGSASYPTVPALWPNRAVRRAVRFGRAVPRAWAAAFVAHQGLREAVAALR